MCMCGSSLTSGGAVFPPPWDPSRLPTFHDGLPLELALQLIEERTIWGCAFTFCKKLFRLEWLVFVNTQKRKNSQHT